MAGNGERRASMAMNHPEASSWGVTKLRTWMSGFVMKSLLIFAVAVFTGVIYGMAYEKWNFGR